MDEISRRKFLIAGGAALAVTGSIRSQTPRKAVENCVFCKIVAGTLASYKLWENKHFLAFLDNKPIMPGHTLIVPKEHHSYLFEMSEDDYEGIFERVRKLEPPLRKSMEAKRIGIIVEGFGVDHVHVHMVPMTGGGQLIQKGKTGVTDAEFEVVAERIRPAIKLAKVR